MTKTELIKSAIFILDNYNDYSDIKRNHLYHCTAWSISSNYSKWILLQSYRTIVAAYDKIDDVLYVFDYYSHTTCKHVAKFQNWLKHEFNPASVKRVNLYNDSRTPKYMGLIRKANDFASVIEGALEK